MFIYVNFKSTNFHFLLILQFSIIKNIFTWSCQDFLLLSLSCVQITQKVPVSSPARITWSFFSTISSAGFQVIWSKLTSHPKHRIVCNLFSNYYVFFLIFKKVVAEVFKIPLFFWDLNFDCSIQTANCYPIHQRTEKTTNMGFDPMLADPNGLTVRRLNHPAILSISGRNKLSFCI